MTKNLDSSLLDVLLLFVLHSLLKKIPSLSLSLLLFSPSFSFSIAFLPTTESHWWGRKEWNTRKKWECWRFHSKNSAPGITFFHFFPFNGLLSSLSLFLKEEQWLGSSSKQSFSLAFNSTLDFSFCRKKKMKFEKMEGEEEREKESSESCCFQYPSHSSFPNFFTSISILLLFSFHDFLCKCYLSF